jgi:hypothetical protein
MALLYQATVTPSKIDLLSAWAPGQPWLGDADARSLQIVGSYRFDDPDGEVGVETLLLRSADEQVLQVPLTYRGSPLAGAEPSLIGTTQHSVLGERWVYNACGDPVYAQALATAILTGGAQAEVDVVTSAGHERRPATTKVSGSGGQDTTVPVVGAVSYRDEGTKTVVRTGNLELALSRVIDVMDARNTAGVGVLTGTWPGQDEPALLASADYV